ncbi:mammalian uncoordinated homology 13 protein, partial [Tanacetum coccineum]
GELDVSKETSKQIDASMFLTMIQSKLGDMFFILSKRGSPPRRAPPAVETNNGHRDRLNSEASVSGHAFGSNDSYTVPSSSKSTNNTDALFLGLPVLQTGLSDDDLRESAYEVLPSSVAFSGIAINSLENPKKDKGSKFLSGLKNRRDKKHTRSYSVQFEQIDTIRAQMQILEAMDECIRQRLIFLKS